MHVVVLSYFKAFIIVCSILIIRVFHRLINDVNQFCQISVCALRYRLSVQSQSNCCWNVLLNIVSGLVTK